MNPATRPAEVTLDPADWESFRALAHRMVDGMLDDVATVRERPAWQPMPPAVRAAFDEPLPRSPMNEAAVYEQFVANVLPYANGNRHPRFWGWVQGNGTPLAMLADMLASGMNPHMAGFNQAPALVEHQVIAWLAEIMGMPRGTSGVLVSGGTMANIVGLAVARHVKAGFDVNADGLQGGDHPRLLVYASAETHGWAPRCVKLLGLGDRALRRIEADDAGRIRIDRLTDAIERDRRAGHRPICVIGNAGTINTGAVDDFRALADVCRSESLWFHVDGAFGALARLSPTVRDSLQGMELADSLAFDLHKWMYQPFEVACALVRDGAAHRETFTMSASYLAETERGVSASGLPFADRSVELTRNFKALKVWMSLKAHGVDAFARVIDQNVRQARHLRALIEAHDELELLAPVALNVVCFRYTAPGLDERALDGLNRELLLRIQESGFSVPSSTMLGETFALRVAITNHRSRFDDFDGFVREVVALGRELR
jgi:glutamate/tyrosine decarboxylase-like PLP-dependent enzyme